MSDSDDLFGDMRPEMELIKRANDLGAGYLAMVLSDESERPTAAVITVVGEHAPEIVEACERISDVWDQT
jgi:2-succinyl-5-enolpyruvyl-6-hydroxy-3-cyclohexene-1-carboxylate synthase